MQVADWIVEALRDASDWRAELERTRLQLAELSGASKIERTLDLAEAMEHIDPDRRRALDLYVSAWRDGHLAARTTVIAMSSELRAFVTLAEVAIECHRETGDPENLVTAGRAFLDAGLVERAAETFQLACKKHPSLAAMVVTSPRLVDVRVVIARARFLHVDMEREIDGCMDRARHGGDGAAGSYLQAARLARLAKLSRYSEILALATQRCPRDEEIARMFEDSLLESGTADDFLAFHRRRLELVEGDAAWVECVRATATELVFRNVHPGLGLRLLRTALERAYASALPDGMRRHVAAWELLIAAAREASSTAGLAALHADAKRAELPAIDARYISRIGRLLFDEPELPTITFRIPTIKMQALQKPAPADATPRAPRTIVPVDVVVEMPNGAFFSAVLRDLSTSGAFVTTKRAIEVGTIVTLEIRLPRPGGLDELQVRTDARIARRTDLGCGLAFVSPPDELVTGISKLAT